MRVLDGMEETERRLFRPKELQHRRAVLSVEFSSTSEKEFRLSFFVWKAARDDFFTYKSHVHPRGRTRDLEIRDEHECWAGRGAAGQPAGVLAGGNYPVVNRGSHRGLSPVLRLINSPRKHA